MSLSITVVSGYHESLMILSMTVSRTDKVATLCKAVPCIMCSCQVFLIINSGIIFLVHPAIPRIWQEAREKLYLSIEANKLIFNRIQVLSLRHCVNFGFNPHENKSYDYEDMHSVVPDILYTSVYIHVSLFKCFIPQLTLRIIIKESGTISKNSLSLLIRFCDI